MKNNIIHNFLNIDEVNLIKETIAKELSSRERLSATDNGHFLNYKQEDFSIVTDEMGRITLREIDLPDDIINKFNILAKKIAVEHGYSEPVLEAKPVFTEYSLEFGEPKLPPHTDLGKSNFLLDYQIYSNIDWGLVIDGTYYPKQDNDVANIFNKNQLHYRPFRLFNTGEVVGVMFFNYYINNIEESTITESDVHLANKEFNHALRHIKEAAGLEVNFE